MQRNKLMGVVALLLCIGMMIPSVSAKAATTIYNNKIGVEDGYDYTLTKQLVTINRQLTVTQHSNSTGVYVQVSVQAEPFR